MQGGLARYINHSCDPNCYTRIVTVEGKKHIAIFSKRLIAPGEELCYDYKVGTSHLLQSMPLRGLLHSGCYPARNLKMLQRSYWYDSVL